jgi:hypothetical protein
MACRLVHDGPYFFMTDFSKQLFSCGSLASIMADKGKSNRAHYDEAVESLKKNEQQYALMNQYTATAEKKLDLINRLKAKVAEYEPIKDEEALSKSCEAFLVKKYVTEKYNRIQDYAEYAMRKGISVENLSICLFNDVHGTDFVKNTVKLKNKYLTGIPDLYKGKSVRRADEVIDIKTPTDAYTFLSVVDAPLTNHNYWQIQGYMALTHAKTGIIAYCLSNTSECDIQTEIGKLKCKLLGRPDYDRLVKLGEKTIRRNMNFDDIPKDERVISFTVHRDNAAIERIYKKIEKCRVFLHEFEGRHIVFSKNYRKSLEFSTLHQSEAE